MAEDFGVRVTIAASEGLLFTSLQTNEPRREIFYYSELSMERALQYYNSHKQSSNALSEETIKHEDPAIVRSRQKGR